MLVMRINVVFEYSRELAAAVFIETARRRTSMTLAVDGEQLSPAARRDALSALAVGESFVNGDTRIDARVRPAVESDFYAPIRVEVEGVDHVPDVAAAIDAAESALRCAVMCSNDFIDRRDAHVDAALDAPLDEWVTRDPERRVASWPAAYEPALCSDAPAIAERLAAAALAAAAMNADDAYARRQSEAAIYAADNEWTATHLDANARQRWLAGLLPTDEFLGAVREVAFASLANFPRYEKLRNDDIEHSDECDDVANAIVVSDDEPAAELTADEWDRFVAIREAINRDPAIPRGAKVEPLVRTISCACGQSAARKSVRVEVEYLGRMLSRKYGL